MTILNWPTQERPREKLLNRGAQHLSEAELLAILFGHGTQGKSAVDLARDLLSQFGGLRGAFAASHKDFCRLVGLGSTKYCQCQAALELSRRYLSESLAHKNVITQPDDVKNFLKATLRHEPREVFACLFLDNRHHSLCFEKLFYGSINMTSIHPRILIQRCLHHNAAAVVLAHNHPSGAADPSNADREITKMLDKALHLIDVRLLDHMIVGDQHVTSFMERGLLAPRPLI